MARRAFLAVPLPAALQQQVAALQDELAASLPEIRWPRAASVHLTLRFFGPTSTDNLEKIREVMLSVALQAQPFAAAVGRLGVFPDLRQPRVLWLGLASEQLATLHAACDERLQSAGLPGEGRSFVPHLTIGRMRRRPPALDRRLAPYAERSLGVLPVDRLVLFESRLLPAGASHIPLCTVPLGIGPGDLSLYRLPL